MFGKAITTYEPEHRRILRANAADFVAARPLAGMRALAEGRSYDAGMFAQMAELGWLGMIPSSEGELDACDLVALHRELGRKVCPEPMIASGVLATQLLSCGDNPASEDRLRQVCAGEIVATLAWQGGVGAFDSRGCGAVARPTKGGWTIDGSLRFVPFATSAQAILVAAKVDERVVIGWFAADNPALAIRQGAGVDRSDLSTVDVTGAFLGEDDVVCLPENGAAILDEALDLARLAMSAELVGAAEEAFSMTLDYLRQRKQFGKAIGVNQALQFAATDIFVQLELANSVLVSAAQRFAAGSPDRTMQVAACKSRCGDAAFLAARQAIQFHGAIGYTHECDVSLYVKRIMQLNACFGNPPLHRQRIARALPALSIAA